MTASSYQKLCTWLNAKASAVRDLEGKANVALFDADDTSAYRDFMRQKATLLAGMALEASPHLQECRKENFSKADEVAEQLMEFSSSAATALRLESVFYMSALLYPDDYVKGTPNNLELWIESLCG